MWRRRSLTRHALIAAAAAAPDCGARGCCACARAQQVAPKRARMCQCNSKSSRVAAPPACELRARARAPAAGQLRLRVAAADKQPASRPAALGAGLKIKPASKPGLYSTGRRKRPTGGWPINQLTVGSINCRRNLLLARIDCVSLRRVTGNPSCDVGTVCLLACLLVCMNVLVCMYVCCTCIV